MRIADGALVSLRFGGTEIDMWTWLGIECPSSIVLCSVGSLRIGESPVECGLAVRSARPATSESAIPACRRSPWRPRLRWRKLWGTIRDSGFMSKIAIAVLLAVGLFVGTLILLEVGRRIGDRRLARDPEGARAGTGVVEGAVFALVGLLIAFTFSGAATRFDRRRDPIVQETNAIGTAYLRLDLLPPDARSALQEDFRRYVDTRLDAYRKLPDVEAAS